MQADNFTRTSEFPKEMKTHGCWWDLGDGKPGSKYRCDQFTPLEALAINGQLGYLYDLDEAFYTNVLFGGQEYIVEVGKLGSVSLPILDRTNLYTRTNSPEGLRDNVPFKKRKNNSPEEVQGVRSNGDCWIVKHPLRIDDLYVKVDKFFTPLEALTHVTNSAVDDSDNQEPHYSELNFGGVKFLVKVDPAGPVQISLPLCREQYCRTSLSEIKQLDEQLPVF